MTRTRRTLILTAIILAVGYVAVAMVADAARLKGALRELGAAGCLFVFSLSAVNYVCRFGRWHYYLSRLGRVLPVTWHLTYYLAGFAFTVSPAKAGEAARSFYLRDYGVTYTESLSALFVERLLDLAAIVMLSMLIGVQYDAYRPLIGGALLAALTALSAVSLPLVPRVIDRLAIGRRARWAKLLASLANLLRSSRRLLRPQPLAVGIGIGLLAWGAEGVGFNVLCQTLGITGPATTFIGIYSVAVLAGSAAFFLPAGIGGMEVVMTTLLIEQGAPPRIAIIATILCRLATLWFAVLLGIAAVLCIEFSGRQQRLRASP